jgi:hypothetical protein
MILSVFVTGNSANEQSQAELLEYSWQQSHQSGSLVRLIANEPNMQLPLHTQANVESIRPWGKHPYLNDTYAGYNMPAALLEWLLRDHIDATILLLDAGNILRGAVTQEVTPGQAIAQPWEQLPTGDGPFKLSSDYMSLQAYCVNRELVLPKVQLPLLIHSSDLLKMSARWLELTGIIRHAVSFESEPPENAVKVAFAIAAAEYQVAPRAQDLSDFVIGADNGGQAYRDCTDIFESSRISGDFLQFLRPLRRPGVRQALVLDQLYVESGWPTRLVKLNTSAAAIWSLCDGQRNLLEIARELHTRFDIPLGTMAADITQAAKLLRHEGAIDLETVS